MKKRFPRSSPGFARAAQLAMAGMSLAATCIAADPSPYGLEAARKSIARMKTAEGLAVHLFAAEPMVQNPTNLDIDSKGRVWFTEAANELAQVDHVFGGFREGDDLGFTRRKRNRLLLA